MNSGKDSNRVARYMGGGQVAIVEETAPECPPGGLLVDTLACGLCSGELMDWYMDRKVPHVLGHEVAGRVAESQDQRFPVGSLVFPHHHAPCMECDFCRRAQYVHCAQWRSTKLLPGGMAERFGVPAANLSDTLRVDDMRPVDAALIEPLACVMKSLDIAGVQEGDRVAVIGLGVMGLMHMLVLPSTAIGYELNPSRLSWAQGLGLRAARPEAASPADVAFVCPGSQGAFDAAMSIIQPGGTIVMFAPLPPGQDLAVPQRAYFDDVAIKNSYSCGPGDTREAAQAIRAGKVRAEQVVSGFIRMEELPAAYLSMKRGEILKPMVVFG
jgi:L-iditol 2-dehydrogenase